MMPTLHNYIFGDPLNEAAKRVLTTQRDDLLEACKETLTFCCIHELLPDNYEELLRNAIANATGTDS